MMASSPCLSAQRPAFWADSTGKERDQETGLDYFGARYMSSAQGRFTSADPLFIELRRLADPQQLNLYSYARNNPLRFIDPIGLEISCAGDTCDDYLASLSRIVGAQLEYDYDGKIKPVKKDKKKKYTKQQSKILEAINDKSHHVRILAGDGATDSRLLFGGPVTVNGISYQAIATGQIAIIPLDRSELGLSRDDVVGHETLEGYEMSKGKSQELAHWDASWTFPGIMPGSAGPIIQEGGLVTGQVQNYDIFGTSKSIGITVKFVTPIPKADFDSKKGAPYAAYPIIVGPAQKKR